MSLKSRIKSLQGKVVTWEGLDLKKSNDRQLELLSEFWTLAGEIKDEKKQKQEFLNIIKTPQPKPGGSPEETITLRWQEKNSHVFTFLIRMSFPYKAKTAANYCSAFVSAQEEVDKLGGKQTILEWINDNHGLNGACEYARNKAEGEGGKKRNDYKNAGELRLKSLSPFSSVSSYESQNQGGLTVLLANDSGDQLDLLLGVKSDRILDIVLRYVGRLEENDFDLIKPKSPQEEPSLSETSNEDIGKAA